MRPAKRDALHSNRHWSKLRRSPAARRGSEYRVVRWIGARKRRALRLTEEFTVDTPSARAIQLSWANTFGRPVRGEHVGSFRSAGTAPCELLPQAR